MQVGIVHGVADPELKNIKTSANVEASRNVQIQMPQNQTFLSDNYTPRYNPVNELHKNLYKVSTHDNMAYHLHNRFNQPDKVTVMAMEKGKWMTNHGVMNDSRIRSIQQEMVNFKALDKHIFTDLLRSVLDTQIQKYTGKVEYFNSVQFSKRLRFANTRTHP